MRVGTIAVVVAAGAWSFVGCSFAAPLGITWVGTHTPTGAPTGLSGLTFAGGTQFYAVEDSGGRLRPVTVVIDGASGAIVSTTFGAAVTLGGSDLEGVAWDASGNAGAGSVYVSDESGATIKEYRLAGGELSAVAVPAVYGSYRPNRSLESLTMRADGLETWTANEEALYEAGGVDDGPLSTPTAGTVVRLQRFTRPTTAGAWTPAGQYAYVTQPRTGAGPSHAQERSGVVDLCVLPDGTLLVLERELDVIGELLGVPIPQFYSRIYEVGLAGATDVSGIGSLNGATYTPATKNALWSRAFVLDNYEGMALGPPLDNGDYSLLLISDGDDEATENLAALRLTGTVPEPASLTLLGMGLLAALAGPRAGR